MPIQVLYEAEVQGASEDITNRVRLYTLDVVQNAEEGSVGVSSLPIDDPAGDYDIVGWRRIRIHETAATGSNTLMYNGWVAERDVSRGPFRTGAGRVWECSLADMNAVISMRVLNEPSANRPAETDVARINWLMGEDEMNRVTETEFISSASPKQMDAVDYRGQTLFDVINDCAQQSGKNFFIYTKQGPVNLTLGLWYDFTGSTTYSSPLRLSNDLADVDNTWTFEIAQDTTLTRDPGRTYSGAYVRFDGGSVYEEDIGTSNVFTRRDAVYSADNVKTSARATARALRYLEDTDVEEDRIKTAFWVPAPKVNFVKQGMRIQFKATHLPGYESFVWTRVLKKQVKEVTEVDESTGRKYLVSLECASNPGAGVAGTCSTNGGTLTIHTLDHPDIPHGNATYAIYTGATWDVVDDEGAKVTGIAPGDYVYQVPAGKCCIVFKGESGGLGVPFNGITWQPTGGDATYYPENGDGLAGHFFWYGNATPDGPEDLGGASLWSFPEYQRVVTGGIADYGIGLNNIVAFALP